MMMNDPKYALVRAMQPQVGEAMLRNFWSQLSNDWRTLAESNTEIENLGPCVLLLPLPSSFPTLCECVATAQRSGLHIVVRLFGQPILSYPEK